MSSSKQNIAVLGAGIMGLCTAYSLNQARHKTTLYDPAHNPKNFPADNASFIAGGMLAPYSEIEHMNGSWIEAGLFGIEFWRNFTGSAGFSQKGSLLIAHPQDHYILKRFQAHLNKTEHPFETGTPAQYEPDISRNFQNGLYLPQEAHLNPTQAMQALLESLKDSGTVFIPQATTPEELSLAFDQIIDCRGLAATPETTLRGVKGELLITRNPDFTLTRPVRLMHPRYPLYIVPRTDHVFMIGATQVESTGNHVALRSIMELSSALYSLHPSFGEAEILHIKSGIRPAYPDNLPRISLNQNIISCNGLFRHGFLLAPIMADIVTQHIAGQQHPFFNLLTGNKPNEPDHQRQSTQTQKAT